MGLAALNPKTLCSSRKAPQGSNRSAGERGAPYVPLPALITAEEEQEKKWHAPVILGGVDVPRGEDVQGQDVGVNERLICFWGVPDPTCKRSTGTPLRQQACEGPQEGQGQPICLHPQQPLSQAAATQRSVTPAPSHGACDRGVLPTWHVCVTC